MVRNFSLLTTPILILIAPFANFILSMEYNLLAFEVLSISLLICLFGILASTFLLMTEREWIHVLIFSVLITLFIDIQLDIPKLWKTPALIIPVILFFAIWVIRKHAHLILLIFFLVVNSVTVIKSYRFNYAYIESAEVQQNKSLKKLPIFIHIILDEHIGIEGIPNDIPGAMETKNLLLNFYQDYRFTVFGSSHSTYLASNDSISGLVNFDFSPKAIGTFYKHGSGTAEYEVLKNKYFHEMHSKGYRLHVYQTNYLDFCGNFRTILDTCVTHHNYRVNFNELRSLAARQRLKLLARMYGKLSYAVSVLMTSYEYLVNILGEGGSRLPIWQPNWNEWDGRVSPISTMALMKKFQDDITSSASGNFYFAHFMLPHYPYVYDQSCAIRLPLFDWKSPKLAISEKEIQNSYFALYFDQIHCTVKRLRLLFEAMVESGIFDDATIIVHGDHGTRILGNKIREENKNRISDRDLITAFSTLFAVKVGTRNGSYKIEMQRITDIFRTLIYGIVSAEFDSHKVFFESDGTVRSKVTLPPIGRNFH